MTEISVNAAEFAASVDKWAAKVMSAASRALQVVAVAVETEAYENASGPTVESGPHQPWEREGPNVRTGWLRRNIKAGKTRRIGFGSYEVDVFSMASYARAVEEGTSRTGKYPYMTPAFAKVEGEAQEIFNNAYRKFRS